MRRVFQLVPFFEPGDAIGNHARRMATILGPAHAGFIVEHAAGELASQATPYARAEVRPEDVLVYHMAHASKLGAWLGGVDAVKVIDYHNITPPEFFRAYDPALAVALGRALQELEALRGQVALAIAHSGYSRGELEGMGFGNTATVPVLMDLGALERAGNSSLGERLATTKRGPDVLFVGRVSPNKRIEDVIKAFTVYRRIFSPTARLWLVGRSDSAGYLAALGSFVGRLGIEEVHLVGSVPLDDLAAYYRSADVFVSMSEHEGFGAPLIEAMHLGVPVVAHAAAAVPETAGGAAVLFSEKRYDEVAALIDLVVGDGDQRPALVAAGRARAAAFAPERFAVRLRTLIGEL